MKILVANVGSTSLKCKLYEMPGEELLCAGRVERIGSDDAIVSFRNHLSGETKEGTGVAMPSYTEAIAFMNGCMLGTGVIEDLAAIDAVGFKTVAAKGYNGVHRIDEEVLSAMRAYLSVAPAHNTAYLEAIGCFRKLLPDTPFVGVFETAFHQTMPPEHYLYSVPYEWYEEYGIRKLGYHGASHGYSASVLRELFGPEGRAVTCHLGGSGSITAIENGESRDTSFGMSLQVGLPQNNRAGDFDPFIIRYLKEQGLSEDAIYEALSTRGGLLGVSGVGRDLRDLTDAAGKGNARAKLAIDLFTESILHYVGAYAAELGGLDQLVFTGGIGENGRGIRAAVCRKLGFLGLDLDEKMNETCSPEHAEFTARAAGLSEDQISFCRARGVQVISKRDSRVCALVIPADEEIVVGRSTYANL